jgi:hypothetical protein
MDDITAKPKLNHNATLIRFYDWVSEWRDRLPLSTDKSNQTMGKKPEQKPHDDDTF